MAVRISAAVQRLQGSVVYAESCPSTIGPITLEVKQTGERSAGNLHAAFDVAGAGNAARSRYCDTRRRKGETTGNTNIDLTGAPVLDPTCEGLRVKFPGPTRQERRALHEKHRKRRHADIGHVVTAVFPAPLVRQTRTGLPKCRYEVLDRANTGLESDSSPIGYGPHPSRFNQSHPYKGRAPSQNENCWHWTGYLYHLVTMQQ